MQRETDPSGRAADPQGLFEEYLDAVGKGEPPDLDALAARAGTRAGELREQVALARTLEAALRLLAAGPERPSAA